MYGSVVWELTLNRPRVLNALNRALKGELADALTRIKSDESIRAVVITGAGEQAFSAAQDLTEAKDMSSSLEHHRDEPRPLSRPQRRLARRGPGSAGRTDDQGGAPGPAPDSARARITRPSRQGTQRGMEAFLAIFIPAIRRRP
jgi:hypothetical protein